MKRNDVFPSKYLKAEDLQGPTSTVIEKVILEDFEDPKTGETIPKATMYLRGFKPLIMNKTNWGIVAALYGEESDDWIGKSMRVYPTEIEAFGERVQAVRLSPPIKALPAVHKTEDGEFFIPPEAK